MSQFFNQKGINRIELLVVAALIIGIIVVAIISFFDFQSNLRDSKRKADIANIAQSLESHYNSRLNQNCINVQVASYCHPQYPWFEGGVPTDPLLGDYINLPQDGDKDFLICAKLEGGGGNAASSDGTLAEGKQAKYFCLKNVQ